MDSVLYHEKCLENLAKEGHLTGLVPTIPEFLLMKGACKVLEHCKITTKIWEQEKIPTINLVTDRLYNMLENIAKFVKIPGNSGSGIMFATELLKQLNIRFPKYGTQVGLNCFGNYLDPSLKGVHLQLLQTKNDTKELLVDILVKHLKIDEGEENPPFFEEEVGGEAHPAEEPPRQKLKRMMKEQEEQVASETPINTRHSSLGVFD